MIAMANDLPDTLLFLLRQRWRRRFHKSGIRKISRPQRFDMKSIKVHVFEMPVVITYAFSKQIFAHMEPAPVQPLCNQRGAGTVHSGDDQHIIFHEYLL